MDAIAPQKSKRYWAVIVITALSLEISLSNALLPLFLDLPAPRLGQLQTNLVAVSAIAAKIFLILLLLRHSRLAVIASVAWLLSFAVSFLLVFHDLGFGRVLPESMVFVFWLGWALPATIPFTICLATVWFLRNGTLE